MGASKTSLPAGITSKTNFKSEPLVTADKKLNATVDWNPTILNFQQTIDGNFERLAIDWDTEVFANDVIALKQRVRFTGVDYICNTSYDVGAGKTFTIGNFDLVTIADVLSMGNRDFSTTTTAPPASQELRLNNATPASATKVFIDDEDTDGTNWGAKLNEVTNGSWLKIGKDADNQWHFKVTGITDQTDYVEYDIDNSLSVIKGTISDTDIVSLVVDMFITPQPGFREWTVDPTFSGIGNGSPEAPFTSLQDTIDNEAIANDTIYLIGPTVENITIDKAINLIGRTFAVIDGTLALEAFCFLDNFTVTGATTSTAGAFLIFADRITIDSTFVLNAASGFTGISIRVNGVASLGPSTLSNSTLENDTTLLGASVSIFSNCAFDTDLDLNSKEATLINSSVKVDVNDTGAAGTINLQNSTVEGTNNANTINEGKKLFSNQVRSTPGSNKAFTATPTFNMNGGNYQKMILTANVTTLTLSNPENGSAYVIVLEQDVTGTRTIPAPTGFGTKSDNSADFSTTGSAVNIFNIMVDPDGNTSYSIETVGA